MTPLDLDSDLDALFSDFGKPVTWSIGPTNYTALGIPDQPDRTDGSSIISTEYSLMMKASDAVSIDRGQAIVVESIPYTVREEPRKLDDGRLVRMELSKT
jgi:hypothetical protein